MNPLNPSVRPVRACSLVSNHSSATLRRHFEQFGPVDEVAVMLDPLTKRSRGFAFVTFSTSEGRDKTIAHTEHNVDGRRVD